MKSFEKDRIERQAITQDMLRTVRLLGEFKGREALYRQQFPQALETLRQVAVVQSIESSNRLEGVIAPPKRIQALVAQKTTPRDRSEQEIAGYRDVLNTIHADYPNIPFTTPVVLQLHRDLYKYGETLGGRWKPVDNEIVEVVQGGTRKVRFHPVPAPRRPSSCSAFIPNSVAFGGRTRSRDFCSSPPMFWTSSACTPLSMATAGWPAC